MFLQLTRSIIIPPIIVPLRLTADQLQQLKHHAQATYPQECCGMLVGRLLPELEVTTIHPVQNSWTPDCVPPDLQISDPNGHSPRDRYWIDPADLLHIMKSSRAKGEAIIGIYHSHPDSPALPSECDRRLAWPEYVYVILSVSAVQIIDYRCWQLNSDHQFQEIEIPVTHSA